jgi:HK97 family phage major capsid protein
VPASPWASSTRVPPILYQRGTPGRFTLADAAGMYSPPSGQRSQKNACWIIHQSVYPQLVQMADASGRLVWLNPVQPGQDGPAAVKMPKALLDGLPLYVTDKLPKLGTTGDVLLCDFMPLHHRQAGRDPDRCLDPRPYFQQNAVAFRLVYRDRRAVVAEQHHP